MSLGRHGACLRKPRAGALQGSTFRSNPSALVRRSTERYTAERKLEMGMEIVWPSAIGEARKWENAHFRLPPKPGSDSSVRPSVWPSANGRTEQRKRNAHLQRHPKIGPDSSFRFIVRPSAVGETNEDQHLCGGFRRPVRKGIIRLNRPSARRI